MYTVLQFKNAKELWAYKMLIECNNAEVNFRDNTLILNCTEAEKEVAVKTFNARLRIVH